MFLLLLLLMLFFVVVVVVVRLNYSIAPRIPPALSYSGVVLMGCWVKVSMGRWVEGAREQQETELQTEEVLNLFLDLLWDLYLRERR